jgi:predicted nucleic acid-binding protein
MTERFLLDTNVLSELARPAPNEQVVAFIASLDELLVPASVLFELERDVRALPSGRRRTGLARWLAELLTGPLSIRAVDAAAATAAAKIEEAARRRGRTIEVPDLFVLGVARAEDLTVATRNVADFEGHGVPVLDPFAA